MQQALPRRHPHNVTARPGPGSDGRVWQIACNERRSIEILNVGEPQSARAGVQLSRIEIAPERLAARRHPLSHLAMEVARVRFVDRLWRGGVVESRFRSSPPA